jgi:GNAT superfamily N-acetyltransferase
MYLMYMMYRVRGHRGKVLFAPGDASAEGQVHVHETGRAFAVSASHSCQDSQMEIRDVVDSDWAAVWGFLQQIVAAGDTYCWPPDTSEDAARMWWMGKPGGRVLVAVDDGAVVGTAELHPNQPAAGSHVANAGFMVSPTVAGRGVGRALAQRVLEVAADDGYAAMQFNTVVETN